MEEIFIKSRKKLCEGADNPGLFGFILRRIVSWAGQCLRLCKRRRNIFLDGPRIRFI